MQITKKQKAFVKHYVASLNATQAYREAYGSDISYEVCKASASRLLTNVNVKEAVSMEMKKAGKRVELTQDYVLDGLKEVYERCMRTEPTIDSSGNITGVLKFNAAGANKALELLGRHLGMFTDKVAIDAEVKQKTQYDLSIPDIERRIGELIGSREESDTASFVSH